MCHLCLTNHEVPKNFTDVPGLCIECKLMAHAQAFSYASMALKCSSKSANMERLASYQPNEAFCKGWAGPLKGYYPPAISSTDGSQGSTKGLLKKTIHKVLLFSQRIEVECSMGGRHCTRPLQPSYSSEVLLSYPGLSCISPLTVLMKPGLTSVALTYLGHQGA